MLKLIVIDDEEETRSGLIETIEWEKLDVRIAGQAEDGSEGYELALVSHPDIALIDVRMPGMDGIECAKAINRELPDCKIIFMSGYTDKEYLKAAIQLQAIDYIEKPIDNNEIYNVIKKTVLLCMSERVKKLREDEIKNKVEYSIKLMKQELAFELVHRNMDVNVLKSKYKEIDIPIDDNFYVY